MGYDDGDATVCWRNCDLSYRSTSMSIEESPHGLSTFTLTEYAFIMPGGSATGITYPTIAYFLRVLLPRRRESKTLNRGQLPQSLNGSKHRVSYELALIR